MGGFEFDQVVVIGETGRKRFIALVLEMKSSFFVLTLMLNKYFSKWFKSRGAIAKKKDLFVK